MGDGGRDVACPQCARVNRVFPEHLPGAATCSSCGMSIPRDLWDLAVMPGGQVQPYVKPKGLPAIVCLKCPRCAARRVALPAKIPGRAYCADCTAPLDYAADAVELTEGELKRIAADKKASDRNVLILLLVLGATLGPFFVWNVWNDARMKQFNPPASPASPAAGTVGAEDGVIPESEHRKIASEIGDKPDDFNGVGVACAQLWVKQHAHDPSSVSFDSWTRVIAMRYEGRSYWTVRATYRAKNGFGALIRKQTHFYMQHDRVVFAVDTE